MFPKYYINNTLLTHLPTSKENLHTFVKILQICMHLQDSVQRSLQNPAEKNSADLHRFAKIENLGSRGFQFS